MRLPRPLLLMTGVLAMTACAMSAADSSTPYQHSPQFSGGKFRNPVPQPAEGFGKMLGIAWNFFFNKPEGTMPATPPPVATLTQARLLAAPDRTLWRLGHSTILLKLRGQFWLTDPVFSERASPFQWAGPKRFHAPPISIEELPPIRAVILSHDHYDHLDEAAVVALAAKTQVFLAPLGVGDRLLGWGVDAAKVQQFDWWQETTLDGLRLVATPAQHFSGRSLSDRNSTLWASWALIDGDTRIYFSGDTGYFEGFKTIGERLGPFDLTLMETGAYDKQWPYVHMLPEQTLQAHLDLRGRWLLPIHNGTFDLAMHSWTDPFERITALAAQHRVNLTTPVIGTAMDVRAPRADTPWWREIAQAPASGALPAAD
jgi:L-ascorbate metabolism protein UlaG (beta-lactamase superfamily)